MRGGIKRFSFKRTVELLGCTCGLIWFLIILVVVPSAGGLRPLPDRTLLTYITFLNVLLVLVSLRDWRSHMFFVPIWVALLGWLYSIWMPH